MCVCVRIVCVSVREVIRSYAIIAAPALVAFSSIPAPANPVPPCGKYMRGGKEGGENINFNKLSSVLHRTSWIKDLLK